MESFLTCFYILEYCYFIDYENDLGGILGAMSPDLMSDGMPIDSAFFLNWEKVQKSTDKNGYGIIEQIDDFLDFYEKQYGFSFDKTRKLLKTKELHIYIDTAKSKAYETCKKHNNYRMLKGE